MVIEIILFILFIYMIAGAYYFLAYLPNKKNTELKR